MKQVGVMMMVLMLGETKMMDNLSMTLESIQNVTNVVVCKVLLRRGSEEEKVSFIYPQGQSAHDRHVFGNQVVSLVDRDQDQLTFEVATMPKKLNLEEQYFSLVRKEKVQMPWGQTLSYNSWHRDAKISFHDGHFLVPVASNTELEKGILKAHPALRSSSEKNMFHLTKTPPTVPVVKNQPTGWPEHALLSFEGGYRFMQMDDTFKLYTPKGEVKEIALKRNAYYGLTDSLLLDRPSHYKIRVNSIDHRIKLGKSVIMPKGTLFEALGHVLIFEESGHMHVSSHPDEPLAATESLAYFSLLAPPASHVGRSVPRQEIQVHNEKALVIEIGKKKVRLVTEGHDYDKKITVRIELE